MKQKSRRTVLATTAGVLPLLAGCTGSTDSDDDEHDDSTGDTPEASEEDTDSSSAESDESDWRSFRSGPTNDGFVETSVPKSEPSMQWRIDLSTSIETTAAVDDGTIYAGVGSALHALEDGESVWRVDLGSSVSGSPAVTDDFVVCPVGTELVVTSRSGDEMRRIDLTAASGAPSFANYQAQPRASSSPAVVGGTAYVGTADDDLVAVTLESGTVEWRTSPSEELRFQSQEQMPDSSLTSPAATDELVVVGTDSGVAAFDATNGGKEWEQATDWPVLSSPAVVDGTVYVDGPVPLALDASSASVEWRSEDAFSSTQQSGDAPLGSLQEQPLAVRSSVAVEDDLVVVNENGRRLIALERSDGTSRWETALEGTENSFASTTGDRTATSMLSTRQAAPTGTSPTIAGDVVLVGTASGLVAVSLADGDELWRFETESQIGVSPVVDGGAVIVGDREGTLFSLEW
ncbi:PQQ-binding-like beta-propeller repeat protein [Natronoglomus mannanivorans]|uniref:PQQ-binding-like beta-propeller repeat protein n=1 Tax=Natronoglomus mannanivorans TaxID=2979990 RepID=A0AAP2Z336_9EURY|nr:PQQ-binding-like beta-propeller repeat protein [Halobacteria archaeon AArc-xg1-1]